MPRYSSFDVFDTVIGRSVAKPTDVFVQTAIDIGESIKLSMPPEVYAAERYSAERRLLARGQFPPLADIAEELEQAIELPPDAINQLLARELEIEKSSLHLIEPTAREIGRCREKGRSIIFISDTYWSSDYLKSTLKTMGVARDEDRVYVSCEFGAGKKSGILFTKVAEALGVPCSEISHRGDNMQADFLGAKKAGVNARLVDYSQQNRFEAAIRGFVDRRPTSTDYLLELSHLSATLQRLRIQRPVAEQVAHDVGMGVAGPLLYAFANALLDWADAHSVRRLFFLSRDGDILLRIASLIRLARGGGPDLAYLQVSRQVVLLATLYEKPCREQLRSLILSFGPTKLGEFIRRVAGDSSGLLGLFDETQLESSLNAVDTEPLISALIKNERLYRELAAHNASHKSNFIGYLTQQKLFSGDIRCALVDVGWRLTIHEAISQLLVATGGRAPLGYYIGIDNVPASARTGRKDAFLWDSRTGRRWIGMESVTRIIEAFCTADHGKTIGYELVNGRYEPQLSDDDVPLYLNWGIRDMRDGILASCEVLASGTQSDEYRYWERVFVRYLLENFWCHPTRQEVDKWGSFPHHVDPTDTNQTVPLHVPSGFISKATTMWRDGSWRGSPMNSWPAANESTSSYFVRLTIKTLARLRTAFR